MKLHYSFKGIKPIWHCGPLPFPEMKPRPGMEPLKAKVHLEGKSSGDFPSVLEIAILLTHHKMSTNESAITVLFSYGAGIAPLQSVPSKVGVWKSVSGAEIIGQIRMPLSQEATKRIRRVHSQPYEYELTLRDVEFIDSTPNDVDLNLEAEHGARSICDNASC